MFVTCHLSNCSSHWSAAAQIGYTSLEQSSSVDIKKIKLILGINPPSGVTLHGDKNTALERAVKILTRVLQQIPKICRFSHQIIFSLETNFCKALHVLRTRLNSTS
jgi:hypothetical protein